MSHRTLLPGCTYRFLYPSINFACPASKLEERRILVKSVRDKELQPLDEETLYSHPFTKCGRWLVTGMDLDKFEERALPANLVLPESRRVCLQTSRLRLRNTRLAEQQPRGEKCL